MRYVLTAFRMSLNLESVGEYDFSVRLPKELQKLKVPSSEDRIRFANVAEIFVTSSPDSRALRAIGNL